MTVPFNVGYVNRRQMAEWDGSNEQDILDWVNAGYTSDKWVVISAQSPTEITFQQTNSVTVTVPLNGWAYRPELVNLSRATILAADKDQYWLSDQYGRPASAADIESP